MKKLLLTLCVLSIAAVSSTYALGLPGGGGKVDTTKIDEAIAAMKDIETKLAGAKAKVETCQTDLDAIAKAHGIENILTDLSKAAALKDSITAEEKGKLQADVQALAGVPADITAVTTAAPDVVQNKIPAALTDIVNQISKNPLAAKDLKDKQTQLEQGKTALEAIATEGPALVDAANNLATTLNGIF